MSDSGVLVNERELARTYDGGDYDDAWDAVNQYRCTITNHSDNPDAGSARSSAPRMRLEWDRECLE